MSNNPSERLILVAEQSGQLYVPNPDLSPLEVDVVSRGIHLQNSLYYLSTLNRNRGFIDQDNADIEQGRSHAPAPVRSNIEKSIRLYAQNAEDEFFMATGNLVLADALGWEPKRIKRFNVAMYSDFLKKYGFPRRYQERVAYRKQLVAGVDLALQERVERFQTFNVSKQNRAVGLRPHKEDITDEDGRYLDTPARLRAIYEDPRAGFIPATNREKLYVLTFLDYLDNPQYPLGIKNQFLEVFNHSQVLRRTNPDIDSKRGPLSITYEFLDYLFNAQETLSSLRQIRDNLMEMPNTRVTLFDESEVIDLSHPGLKALVRYIDLRQFMEKGENPTFRDPMRTQTYRWTKEGPGRHKHVEDFYTGRSKYRTKGEYVLSRVKNLNVGSARSFIDQAIEDQEKRARFMELRIGDIAYQPPGMENAVRKVLATPMAVAANALVL